MLYTMARQMDKWRKMKNMETKSWGRQRRIKPSPFTVLYLILMVAFAAPAFNFPGRPHKNNDGRTTMDGGMYDATLNMDILNRRVTLGVYPHRCNDELHDQTFTGE